MDRNFKIEIIVGIFIIVGVIAFSRLALEVSGITASQYTKNSYSLYANFNNIGGLNSKSKVTMAGVRIGSVGTISLDRERENALVELSIDEDIDFLTTDTSAAILTSGLLGEQYIELTSGADEEKLSNSDYITLTQSALVLENLISRFLFERGKDN